MTHPPHNNEDTSLCARCGGACCRTLPGFDHPDRLLAGADPADALAAMLADHEWVLSPHPWRDPSTGDWLTLYYPRPATIQEREARSLTPIPGEGHCNFLTEGGCRLPFAERPRLCQTLEPDIAFACSSPWGKRDAAIAWLPHQALVHDAVARLDLPPLNRGDTIMQLCRTLGAALHPSPDPTTRE